MKRQHHYSKLDVLMASATQPMPREKRNYQLSHIMQALASIAQGSNPSKTDWQLLTDAVNLTETLVLAGELQDESGLLQVAVESMAKAAQRHKQGQPIRLDGPGMEAVQAIVQAYTEALDHLPERLMKQCHRATERRIWDIVDGKQQSHDVLVTSL